MSEISLEKKILNDNDKLVNKYMSYILEFILLIGPILTLGIRVGIFDLTYRFCITIFIASVFIFLMYRFLVTTDCKHRIPKYFGLLSIEMLIGVVATKATVGIYISYALVSFLSCMYYDYKLTRNISIIGYFVMISSLTMKYVDLSEQEILFSIQKKDFISMIVSFTIEYTLVSGIACLVAKRSRTTLKKEHDYNEKIKKIQKRLITGFANLVESRDEDTGMHIKNTSEYVRIISEKLRDNGHYIEELNDEIINMYALAAPLHDMGKLRIPDAILRKNGKLTPEEFEIVKIHPEEGEKIINENMKEIEDERYLETARMMALYHHEKWDGSGYPCNLKENDIPLCARIMAAADVLDALLSNRAYKRAFTIQKTMEIFEESRGKHFEPCIVDAVLMLKDEIQLISMANNIN